MWQGWRDALSLREGVLLSACAALSFALISGVRSSRSPALRRRIVLEQIATHTSIRKFKALPVPEPLLREVLDTAARSSNNGNMQTYSIIVTRDLEARKKLALIHDNSAIAKAPVLLTFVADWTRMVRWCEQRGAKPDYASFNAFLTGNNDAMVTAQSAALAAEAVGLGICFLGSTTWETQRLNEFFHLPKGVHVVTSLMLGFPDEKPALRARLPGDGHLHQERYKQMPDQEVLAYYKDREEEGWNRYINLYGSKWVEKLSAHSLANLAQVYTCLKYSSQDFRLWSRRQLESLKEQGFMDNDERPSDGPCAVCGKLSHCIDPARFCTVEGDGSHGNQYA